MYHSSYVLMRQGYSETYMGRHASNLRVVAYRKDGTLFRIYSNSKATHRNSRTIDKCIRGETSTAFGYIWRRYKVDSIPEKIEPLEVNNKISSISPIALVNEKGEIIKHYPSIRKASLDNKTDPHTIRDVLTGRYKTANGKKYRFLSEHEIEEFGYKNGKKISRTKRAVIQYTLKGEYVKTYPSINSACISIHKIGGQQSIKNCLIGKTSKAYGFIWKYEGEKSHKRPLIYQYDLNGNLIGKHASIKEASVTSNISYHNISNVIHGHQKSAGGYIWKKR